MKQGKKLRAGKAIWFAVAAVILTSAAFCCLMGLLICKDAIRMENAKIPVLVFMMCALFAACCCAARSVSKGKLQASFAVTAGVAAVMLIGKMAVHPASQSWNLWQILGMTIVSALAGVIASRKRERRR